MALKFKNVFVMYPMTINKLRLGLQVFSFRTR